MKIRNGFVSNSSSSSFVLFGVDGRSPATEAILKAVEKKVKRKKDEEDWGYHERVVEKLEEVVGKDLTVIKDYECGSLWIGKDPCDMPDEMTMKEFKQSVVDKLCKASKLKAEDFHSTCQFFVDIADY